MRIITKIQEMKEAVRAEREKGRTVGFVPTMGYLHAGHSSLLDQARKENDIVCLSIFVNPTQFGPNEDLETYPRDMDRDQLTAEKAGVDFIFFPTVQEMYGDGPSVSVTVTGRTNVLCGRQRPGHFDGVATVLTKLFHIITPDRAYFGMKDAQQVAVVRAMVEDLNFDLQIVPVPIVREEDGLALSSRNVYLLEEERAEAREINAALELAMNAVRDGERDVRVLTQLVKDHIVSETSGEIDYIEIYRYPELTPVDRLEGEVILACAVKFSKARLIDNRVFTV